jgi:hypothetical protein
MKHIGLLILIVGVGLSAAYGSRLSPAEFEQKVALGASAFRDGDVAAALEALCEAAGEGEIELAACTDDEAPAEDEAVDGEDVADGDEAPESDEAIEDETAEEEAPAVTRESLEAAIAADRSQGPFDDEATQDAFDAWLVAREAAIDTTLAAADASVPSPSDRLSGWAGDSGPLFGLGLLLVIIGASMSRIAVRKEVEAEGDASDGKAGGPIDFGHLLGDARDRVSAMATEFDSGDVQDPRAQESLKLAVEGVLGDCIEPLTTAGPQLQIRYGLEAFAHVFDPLSGAERRLNRTWSALVDHHGPEALDSVKTAAALLDRTVEALGAATKK